MYKYDCKMSIMRIKVNNVKVDLFSLVEWVGEQKIDGY